MFRRASNYPFPIFKDISDWISKRMPTIRRLVTNQSNFVAPRFVEARVVRQARRGSSLFYNSTISTHFELYVLSKTKYTQLLCIQKSDFQATGNNQHVFKRNRKIYLYTQHVWQLLCIRGVLISIYRQWLIYIDVKHLGSVYRSIVTLLLWWPQWRSGRMADVTRDVRSQRDK